MSADVIFFRTNLRKTAEIPSHFGRLFWTAPSFLKFDFEVRTGSPMHQYGSLAPNRDSVELQKNFCALKMDFLACFIYIKRFRGKIDAFRGLDSFSSSIASVGATGGVCPDSKTCLRTLVN